MKVAVVISNPNLYGGVNKFTSDLINIFKSHNFKVAVCSWFKPINGKCYDGFTNIDKVFLASWFSKKIKGKLWKILFASCSAVKRCIKKFKPDVIINANVEPAIFRVVSDNIIKVQYCHFPTELKVYKHDLIRLIYRIPYWYYHYKELTRLNAVVCNSNYTFEIARAIWGNYISKKKFHVIYPMVDLTRFKRELLRENKICYVGRIDIKKGINHVIKAYLQIYNKFKPKLIIAGGVSEKNISYYRYLKKKIEKLQMKNYPIELKANVPYKEITEILLTSKIMASYNEGEHFGIVPVESQAAGCVPIVADSGGQKETVLHFETGFRAKSPKEIKKYMEYLLSSTDVWAAMSRKAKQWAEEFSTKKIGEKWIRLIENLTISKD